MSEKKSTSPDGEVVCILSANSRDIISALNQANKHGSQFDVVTIAGGVEALEVLNSNKRFNVMIIDLARPRLEGARLIALIRATPATVNQRILVVGCEERPASGPESLEVGANDYIARPFEWQEFAKRVQSLADG